MWVRLDDSTAIERRHRALSDSANWLLVCLLCYSNREGTDGLVDRTELEAVRPGADPGVRAAALAELEQAGAVEPVDQGWRLLWLVDLQPTAEEVRLRKEQTAKRQRESRERKAARTNVTRDEARDATRDEARDEARDATRESRSPVPSRPVPSRPGPARPKGKPSDARASATDLPIAIGAFTPLLTPSERASEELRQLEGRRGYVPDGPALEVQIAAKRAELEGIEQKRKAS